MTLISFDFNSLKFTFAAVADFGNDGETKIQLGQHLNIQDFTSDVLQIPFKDQNTNTASGLRELRKIFQAVNGKFTCIKQNRLFKVN